MKIFKNGLCYVDKRDARMIPEDKFRNYRSFDGRVYAIFSGVSDIDYMRERKDIVDYNEVYGLNSEDLDDILAELFSTIETLEGQLQDEDTHLKYQSYRTLYYSVLDYKNNKRQIDQIVGDSFSSERCASVGYGIR